MRMSRASLLPRPKPLRLFAILACMSGITLAGCGPRLNVKPEQVVDLSGQWQLNASLSDDPRALLEKSRPSGRRGGVPAGEGQRPPGGMGPPPGSGPGAPGGSAPARRTAGEPASIEDYLAQPGRLTIEQGLKELRLVADGSPTRFIYGEKFGTSSMRGVSERRSGWEGSAFVTYEEVREGPDVTCTYALSGTRLIVSTDVSGGGVPRTSFRTVYDRVAVP